MANLEAATTSLLRLLLLAVITHFGFVHSNGECRFPQTWIGTWFQSGIQLPIQIHSNNISTKGRCIKSTGEKFLIEDKKENCYRCVVIHERHTNVLQFKETYCLDDNVLDRLCATITGDAQLYSMFRTDSKPEECPFKGSYVFTYSRGGYKDCTSPLSNIDSCTENWKLLFRFQACPDVPGTESTVEELECLATWKEGSTRYLVGKLHHKMTTTDEDIYRCFIYENHKEQDHSKVIQIAQSGDATCNGLSSTTEGSRTLKLYRTVHPTAKCQFPSWVVHSHHWHTLDNHHTFTFGHKNSRNNHNSHNNHNNTLRIVNATNEMQVVCTENLGTTEKQSTIVTHFTSGCKNGYVCMIFHKRGNHVIEVQRGHLTSNQDEACHRGNFDKQSAEFMTLITPVPQGKPCPYLGKYNFVSAKWHLHHEWGSCQGFSSLRVGCNSVDTLEFQSDCPPHQKIESYECHADWQDNGTSYLITSVKGTKQRYCFAYTEIDKVLQFSRLQDSCSRNIQPGVGGLVAFNVTSNGHCNETPNDGVALQLHQVLLLSSAIALGHLALFLTR